MSKIRFVINPNYHIYLKQWLDFLGSRHLHIIIIFSKRQQLPNKLENLKEK